MWSTSATITTITPGCKQPKNSNKPEGTVWLTSRKAVFQWQQWKHNDCIFLASVTDSKFLTKVCNTPYLHVAFRWGFDNTPYLHVALRWGSDRHLFMYTMYTSTVVSLLWTSVRCTRLWVFFARSCLSQPADYSATAQGVWHGGKKSLGLGITWALLTHMGLGCLWPLHYVAGSSSPFWWLERTTTVCTHTGLFWISTAWVSSSLGICIKSHIHPVTEQDTSALKNTLQFQGQSSRQVQNWPPTRQKLMHLTVQALLSQMFHRPVAAYPIKMAASVLNSFCLSAEITASNLMHPSIVPPLTLLHELRNCTHFSWSLIGHSRLVCTRANFTVQCSTYCWDKTERTRKLFHK